MAARMRWGAVIILLVAFASLGIMYAIVSKDCVVCKSEANVVNQETGEKTTLLQVCHDYDGAGDLSDVEDCNKTWVVGSFAGFILSPLLLLIPCIMMCCATSPRDQAINQRLAAARGTAAAPPKPPPAAAAARPAGPTRTTPAPAAKKPGAKFSAPKVFKKKGSSAPADPLSQPAF